MTEKGLIFPVAVAYTVAQLRFQFAPAEKSAVRRTGVRKHAEIAGNLTRRIGD